MSDASAGIRRSLLRLAVVPVILLGCLVGGELFVRLLGFQPVPFRGGPDFKPHYRPHPTLGWVHVPGSFSVEAGHAEFLEDGRRVVAPASPDADSGTLILVGGSFTEGVNVDDDATFAWKLQASDPGRRVVNFGTGGHGTLQSLAMLEERLPLLEADGHRVDAIVYGFIYDHLLRNVGHPSWRKTLYAQSRGTEGLPVAVPYALLGADASLQRHPPTAWPLLGLCRVSALAALIVDRVVNLDADAREEQMWEVGLALMSELSRLAADHGARFAVVNLFGPPPVDRRLADELALRNIDFVDCHKPEALDPRWLDPVTRHPTEALHSHYAECIGAWLTSVPPPATPRSPAPRGLDALRH